MCAAILRIDQPSRRRHQITVRPARFNRPDVVNGPAGSTGSA
ncbi:MAG: hypothetical protein R5N92_02500 [Cutibacterium granulosum]|jgi:hypothetical protein|nr:hypothetical protein [Cutibacterium granulosum]MEA5633174.1 hypothetical protein [Cutibacterium granulosum]MEA5636947.1 hypothetical protein [Cutibacterium granulosum]MEA5641184.1 hypothetical protein [Cutibacterium granulosum]MEA5643569.1 hypothetical protein [Cutibacterium granulosum]